LKHTVYLYIVIEASFISKKAQILCYLLKFYTIIKQRHIWSKHLQYHSLALTKLSNKFITRAFIKLPNQIITSFYKVTKSVHN
jgi:hypothetical protein